jgi:predicted phage terminase large subunit-like protein
MTTAAAKIAPRRKAPARPPGMGRPAVKRAKGIIKAAERIKKTEDRFVASPQSGPQEQFLRSTADIAIYGGAAGAGKTYASLLEPLYHVGVPGFMSVTFRREYTQITNAGGLWDESMALYPNFGSKPLKGNLSHTFPSGARLEFGHLNAESSVLSWQGSQIPLIQFDELTHFSRTQFFYMLSRNRSTCGVRPYVRATTNPDADSWVAEFISWWIDQETGLPIKERSGVIRWFIRVADTLIWGDSKEELIEKHGDPTLGPDDDEQVKPKSVTFIGASIFDNRELMRKDPGYLANLRALPVVERERLLGGNWKIRKTSGLYYKRLWVRTVDMAPAGLDLVRHWDLAATEKTDGNDPDWTVGVLMGRLKLPDDGGFHFFIVDRIKFRGRPHEVEQAILNTASADGRRVKISLPQDPGQAGKAQARRFASLLAGYQVKTQPENGDKVTRFGPFSAQAESGNVSIVRGHWNDDFHTQLEGFPEASHDDDADATSGAFNQLLAAPKYEYAGQLSNMAPAYREVTQ